MPHVSQLKLAVTYPRSVEKPKKTPASNIERQTISKTQKIILSAAFFQLLKTTVQIIIENDIFIEKLIPLNGLLVYPAGD